MNQQRDKSRQDKTEHIDLGEESMDWSIVYKKKQ